MVVGLKSTCKKRCGQAAQAWRWDQKAQARRYMVNQHKRGERVKKQKKEEIWSSVTVV